MIFQPTPLRRSSSS
ncbi:hypothetical protein AYI69_g3769, partial [Smittium culicis]